jgi:hypothetical protein
MLASVALDVLMLLGDAQELAAANVARAARKWPGFEPSAVTPVTVKNWRNQMLVSAPPERAHFDQLRAYLAARPDPRDEVAKLLAGPRGVAKTWKCRLFSRTRSCAWSPACSTGDHL